jgi:hypothetical protein
VAETIDEVRIEAAAGVDANAAGNPLHVRVCSVHAAVDDSHANAASDRGDSSKMQQAGHCV